MVAVAEVHIVDTKHSKSGQAVVEFCVGIIAVLAVFGGLFQLAELCKARMNNRVDATERAARASAGDFDGSTSVPSYISQVTVGDDEYAYSEDDQRIAGDSEEAYRRMVTRMRPDLARIYESGSDIAALGNGYEMRANMGLVRGSAAEYNIPILPVVRRLIYDADNVDLESEVWTTRLGGFY